MNNHEVESILCQVKCDCCGSVTTYDEEDIKKLILITTYLYVHVVSTESILLTYMLSSEQSL